jgi:hypothetical protein
MGDRLKCLPENRLCCLVLDSKLAAIVKASDGERVVYNSDYSWRS